MPKKSVKKGKLLVGNWKMNLTPAETTKYVKELISKISSLNANEVVVCPPSIDIPAAATAAKASKIKIGAQNIYFEERGAYTGEISALMLTGIAEYVLIGHSERRHIFGEKDDLIARKLSTALHHKLIPILCVGETLIDRESGHAERVVGGQLNAALHDVSKGEISKIVIAYEPVWAIGTGKPIKPADGESMAKFIRSAVDTRYGKGTSSELKILYGGSVNSENVESFIGQPNFDGALVGGASVFVDEWTKILKTAGVTVKK